MKKFISFLLVLFFCLNAFSLSGLFFGEKNLRVIRTEWFDIIYSERSEISAKKIACVADSYYKEISEKLGCEMKHRFPVSVTSAVESMNAYFSMALFNHIVIYDTFLSDDLDMDEDTVENVFYHELTHAVSLNIKSNFVESLSHIGDFVTPAGVSLTTFWFEGVTVSFEGRETVGGRLNDPFATQLVSLAKLNAVRGVKKFPSWRDVTGARDTIPGGTDAYMFGSSFAKYLQEKYGMEKYGDLWKNAGKSTSFSFSAGVFKKTYGIKMDDAWRDFYEWIPLLETSENVPKSLISHKKSNVRTFDIFYSESELKIAWFDSQSGAVFIKNLKSGKTKRILSITGIQKLNFSDDGKFLSVTRLVPHSNIKSEVGFINIEKKKYNTVQKTDSVNAWFDSDGKLNFSSIQEEKNKKEFIFSPISLGDGKSARIIKRGLDWRIDFDDAKNENSFSVDFGKKIVHNLHSLKSNNGKIFVAFTWAELGKGFQMLPRVGFLSVDFENCSVDVELSKIDTVFPIFDFSLIDSVDITSDVKCFCVFGNYDSKILCEYEFYRSDFESVILDVKIKSKNNNSIDKQNEFESDVESENLEVIGYNPFRYYKNGLKLPLGIVSSINHDFSKSDSMAFLGFTFASSNPWTSNQMIFSAGFDPMCMNGGVSAEFSTGNDAVAFLADGTVMFDGSGFLQTHASLGLSSILMRGVSSSISLGIASQLFYGDESEFSDYWKKDDDPKILSVSGLHTLSMFYLNLSNVRKVAPGLNQNFGVYIKPFLAFENKNFDINGFDYESRYLNVGSSVGLHVPGFIPLEFSATIFPSESYFASASVSALLFSCEIQKGIPALSLFVNRFYILASYVGKIEYCSQEYFDIRRVKSIFENVEKSDYSDLISFTAAFDLKPNTSYFAGTFGFSMGGTFIYRPNPQSGKSNFGFGLYLISNL